jgi:hypothetical protein
VDTTDCLPGSGPRILDFVAKRSMRKNVLNCLPHSFPNDLNILSLTEHLTNFVSFMYFPDCLSYSLINYFFRVSHIPPGSVSQVGQQAGVLLLKYNTSLELWRLGECLFFFFHTSFFSVLF